MQRTTSNPSHHRRTWAAIALTTTLAAALAGASGASAQDPSATPASSPVLGSTAPGSTGPFTAATLAAPGSDPLGIPYQDWASRWWSWLLGSPADANPAMTDACDTGQGPDAVLIPQTFFGVEHAVTCHVAAGQPVLVSPGGSICTQDPGQTDADIAACVADSDTTILAPSVTVDGQPIAGIDAWFVTSDPFELVLPEGNLFDAAAGPTRAISSGWFVMLSDLAPGSHTIVVHDETTDPEAGTLVAELTATVEVAAE